QATLYRSQSLTTRLHHLLDQCHQRRDVAHLVDQIGCQDDRKLQILRRIAPVHLQRVEIFETVGDGVVAGEAQSRGVVVAEGDAQTYRQGGDARQTEATSDFQRAP